MFLFQIGSIKSWHSKQWKENWIVFLFQIGSIKSYIDQFKDNKLPAVFLFQIGSIKRSRV